MWKKLLGDPKTKIEYGFDQVDGNQVRGHWVADYVLFGRPVHNELTTTMTVKDGKIVCHEDQSDWARWAPQALPLGRLSALPAVKALAIALIRSAVNH